jgi:type II secretory pathway component PulF
MDVKRLAYLLAVMALLALTVVPAFAQTPETPDSGALITSASTAMTDWNLWAFLIAFGVAGLAVFVGRGVRRMIR